MTRRHTERPGSISSGTLRADDLLSAFAHALQGATLCDGDYLSRPENFTRRGYLSSLIDSAFECDPETDPDAADCLIDELTDALNEYAPAGHYFGTHEGDGADFGFWPTDDSDGE